METESNRIQSVYFWKRSSSSVEEIDEVRIIKEGKNYVFHCNKVPSKEEENHFFERLIEMTKDTTEEFRGMKYEDDKSDFSLKFYLEITFANHTYLSVKGLFPFRQPHFKDIIDLFSSLI